MGSQKCIIIIIIIITVFIFQLAVHIFPAMSDNLLSPYCVNNIGNYTENSAYKANLNTVLSTLSSNVDIYGFYNASVGRDPDRVNAIVLCRGDVDLPTCRACVTNSTQELIKLCPNQKEAMIWYDNCMFYYSNNSIVGTLDTRYSLTMSNPQNVNSVDQFNQNLRSLLDDLRGQAMYGGPLKKFAARNTTAPDFKTIRGLVQCTPDLSADDCGSCLIAALESLSSCCDGKVGGRVLYPSCNLRYEITPFFNANSIILPPSPSTNQTNATTTPEPGKSPSTDQTNSTTSEAVKSDSGGGKDSKGKALVVIIPIISVFGGLMLIATLCLILKKKKKKKKENSEEEHSEAIEDFSTLESLQYDFNAISVATNGFSDTNKLGQGGFGAVYKGKLPNGREIAVKRLSRNSEQGDVEFKNEVLLVAKLQHRNLVRLLGFCIQGTERLLIYEFMPNGSLDQFMFDPVKRAVLDWDIRLRIIGGVVKGLLYLHEDSRLRIIHRDLKASNVLLDEDMNPKISDFGMARLFLVDETQANTSKIVGTYGYMAPEYAMYGQFSPKSDVYSFGVLVLEIASGKKNHTFSNEGQVDDLASYAWKNWHEGTATNLIDPTLMATQGSIRDIIRCIHVGLLCVQEDVADRPTMASVLLMLSSSSLTLPMPSEPAFLTHSGQDSRTSRGDDDKEGDHSGVSSSRKSQRDSGSQTTSITQLYPR